MTEDELAHLRAARPEPVAPSDEVVRRAKERLMRSIMEEQHNTTVTTQQPSLRWRYRIGIGLAAASVAVVTAVGMTVIHDGPPTGPDTISAGASPAQALESAAQLVGYTTQPDSGPVRHLRFRNETDPGAPTYDVYIRPDGSAMVGRAGGALHATDGYLPTADLQSLPSDPATLREAMARLAAKRGYGLPGQVPERALFRLAIDLLTDPGVSDEVKAGVYRVIEGFDLAAVKATNEGLVKDEDGRVGIGLRFQFEEGVTETLVIDPRTAAVLSDTSELSDGTPFGGQVYLQQDLAASIPQSSA